jgi:hypothetical protein
MVVCDFNLDSMLFDIPAEVILNSSRPEISLSEFNTVFGADCWISCFGALPHLDREEEQKGLMIVNMAVVSAHDVADMKCPYGMPVMRGSLFIIDPGIGHSLIDKESFFNRDKSRGFIGLQWEVKRDELAAEVKSIIENIESEAGVKAIHRKNIDSRYVGLVS